MLSPQEPLDCPFRPVPGPELHPRYAELRGRPMTRVRLGAGQEAWLAISHADVRTVLSDRRFRLTDLPQPYRTNSADARQDNRGLMSQDPPEHTRLRSLTAEEFTPRRIERLRPRAQEIADGLLDDVTASADPVVDLMEQFAVPLPATLTCELLAIPLEYGRFWAWVEAEMLGDRTPEQQLECAAAYHARIAGLVKLRRENPGPDPIGVLLRACDEQRLLTEDDLVAMVGELLVAGFGTVARQTAATLYHLLVHPGKLSWLRAHPESVPDAVEELLRYAQTVEFTIPRRAAEDMDLGGVRVRAGDLVVAGTAAANRDPAVFPAGFDLVRPGPPHLGFGFGAHYCLGAHLARLEMQVAVETALRRLPGLRLAVAPDEVPWTGGIVDGPRALPVTFDRPTERAGHR